MIRAILRDLFALALVGAVVAACAAPSILTPRTGPGTSYPCGLNGHECPDGQCCGNAQVCCDGTTCTAGYCEFVGGGMRAPDAGGPVVVHEFPPVSR